MKIQSLSIAVPAKCPNKCEFCVARMHREDYINQIEKNQQFRSLYKNDYMLRLAYARDNGCNSLIFTGNGEPMLNQDFLEDVGVLNRQLRNPFRQLEIQTSGYGLNEGSLRWLRNEVGITTISLSLSALDDVKNAEINRSQNWVLKIRETIKLIKKYDFNVRLSLNMTSWFNDWDIQVGFNELSELGVDQVTIRELYADGDTPQADWVRNNAVDPIVIKNIEELITTYGTPLRKLSYGATVYDFMTMSFVVDTDCMSSEKVDEDIKYTILREDCKLYSHWDKKGSKIF